MIAALTRCAVIVGLLLMAATADAFADRRVALVIGNSAYQAVTPLPNPVNDARAVADLLKAAGFDVVENRRDLNILDMRRTMREFTEIARNADIAVIYYAGHGIEIDGINYLIPTDAALEKDLDVDDETLSIDRVMRALDLVRRLRVIILDACRDNPFARTMKRTSASRSVGRGLARVEPATSDTLIAFAAKAGSTTLDGDGTNSPYALALLNNLARPGLDLRIAFGRVRDEVLKATANKQEPFVYGSLGGSTVSIVPLPEPSAGPAASTAADPNVEARRDYEYFERVGTREAWDAFLTMHGAGPYADLARAQRARVVAAQEAKADAMAAAAAQAAKPAPPPGPATVVATAPAAVPEAAPQISPAGPTPGQVARMLQTELKRTGCYGGAIDGNWNDLTRRALDSFSRRAGVKLDSKAASLAALETVRDAGARVCPLECRRGFRAADEECVKIACDAGFLPDDKGICRRTKERAAARPPRAEPRAPSARSPGTPAKSGTSAQFVCGRTGCQQVRPGCTVRQEDFRGETVQVQVCN